MEHSHGHRCAIHILLLVYLLERVIFEPVARI